MQLPDPQMGSPSFWEAYNSGDRSLKPQDKNTASFQGISFIIRFCRMLEIALNLDL